MKEKLEKLGACTEGIQWAFTQSDYKTAWQNCERGDWMLWLAKALNVDDRKLALARYYCANQVRHLMKDQRSLDAMDAALKYANGEISRDELNTAATYAAATYAAAAYNAAAAADDDAAAVAEAAAYAVAAAADAEAVAEAVAAAADAAVAEAVAAAADAAAAAYRDAISKSLKRSADICREILTEDVLTAYEKQIKL